MAGRNDDDMVRSVRVRSTTYLFAGRPDAWSPTYGTPTKGIWFSISNFGGKFSGTAHVAARRIDVEPPP